MTEGGIASWKKKEGESFAAGDVLLEIETDKATIDVEAQDDGVMGKILAADGAKNIPVGKTIALLAEEGDDIANLEAPKDEDAAPPKPAEASSSSAESAPSPPPSAVPDKTGASSSTPPARPHHGEPSSSRPLFPSVLRLLTENGIQDADKIKGTGVRGMITKGDVLTYLGKASGPLGTWQAALQKEEEQARNERAGVKKVEAPVPLDGAALRRLIVSNMLQASQKQFKPAPAPTPTFDDIIADYLPSSPKSSPSPPEPSKPVTKGSNPFDGLF